MHQETSDKNEEATQDVHRSMLQEEGTFMDNGMLKNKEELTFEEIIRKVGNAGRFQLIQCTLCLSPLMILCFMGLGFVFIGYTPPHVCNTVNETELLSQHGLQNESTAKVNYGKCDIIITTNQSGNVKEIMSMDCPKGRHFPGGKHMTLVSEWDLVCEKTGRAEIAQLLYTLGNVIGALILPQMADRFGRKPLICITTMLNMIIEFGIAFAPNMYVVCTALFLDGIAFGGVGSVYLVLGMEILIARHRQVFGVVACQYWVFCVMVVGIVGYLSEDVGWRYFQAAGALSGLMALPMLPFMTESPRWLAINGRRKEALIILKKASKQNGKNFSEVKKAFDNYVDSIETTEQQRELVTRTRETNEKALDHESDSGKMVDSNVNKVTLFSMFTRKDTLVLLLVMWYLWTTCNIAYYGIYMSSSNLAGNRFLNFCLMGIVEIPANFLVLYMMNKMGRLHVVRIFLGLAAFSLMASLFLATFSDESQGSHITSTVFFIFGKFAITSFFNAVFIFTPEIFPTVLRSSGNGSCKSLPRIGSMLAPYTRPLYSIAKWAPGLIFTSLCFIGLFLTFLLPETKDKILPTKLNDIRKNRNCTPNEIKNKHGEL